MEYTTGTLVKIKNSNLPYANETGTITGFVNQGKGKPRLLVLRLDHGYQAKNVGYPDIRYTAVVEESYVEPRPADEPRSFTKRICIVCKKPCFSSLMPMIAHDINGQAVCQNCENSVFFDHEKITFVSVTEEMAQRKEEKRNVQAKRKAAREARAAKAAKEAEKKEKQ